MKTSQAIITLGSDPELMLFDTSLGKIVSAIKVLKNNKHYPTELGDGIKMYADNVLVEASFPPKTRKTVVGGMREVFARMQEKLGPRYRLTAQAAHVYDKDQLTERDSWEVGCNPNFDAYSASANQPGDFTSGLRTGSFHIHIGWDKLLPNEMKNTAIKVLDIVLGTSSVLFDKDPSAPIRRKLYGKAGEFRPTPYGVEYRVLGNYALRSPMLTELAFDLVHHAMDFIKDGLHKDLLDSVDTKEVIKAINHNDTASACGILTTIRLPSSLMKRVRHNTNPEFYSSWKA